MGDGADKKGVKAGEHGVGGRYLFGGLWLWDLL
jgi:hypothetical protein